MTARITHLNNKFDDHSTQWPIDVFWTSIEHPKDVSCPLGTDTAKLIAVGGRQSKNFWGFLVK